MKVNLHLFLMTLIITSCDETIITQQVDSPSLECVSSTMKRNPSWLHFEEYLFEAEDTAKFIVDEVNSLLHDSIQGEISINRAIWLLESGINYSNDDTISQFGRIKDTVLTWSFSLDESLLSAVEIQAAWLSWQNCLNDIQTDSTALNVVDVYVKSLSPNSVTLEAEASILLNCSSCGLFGWTTPVYNLTIPGKAGYSIIGNGYSAIKEVEASALSRMRQTSYPSGTKPTCIVAFSSVVAWNSSGYYITDKGLFGQSNPATGIVSHVGDSLNNRMICLSGSDQNSYASWLSTLAALESGKYNNYNGVCHLSLKMDVSNQYASCQWYIESLSFCKHYTVSNLSSQIVIP